MHNYHFLAGPIFYENQRSNADIVINQGGTDSGKTYGIMQLLFVHATTWDAPSEDPIITILAESVPNLKAGAWRLAKQIIGNTDSLRLYVRSINETDRVITFITGWVMEFVSCQDEQSAKQGKRQYLFCNEANGVAWEIFWQKAKRARRRTYIDYNPSAAFWAHDKLIGTKPEGNDLAAVVDLIISDHRHNPFLSEADHRRTEGIRDPELWKVYARGMTGNLDGLIYPTWTMIDDDDYPHDADFVGGLDFGYTSDETAPTKVARIGNSLFLHEIAYEPDLSPKHTNDLFLANGFKTTNPIYCDHDKDAIASLQRLRSLRYLPAKKGPNSKNPGILRFRDFKVFYTSSSKNMDRERKRYMWMKDPVTKKPTNVPVDGNDHLMDSSRYAVWSHWTYAATG